MKLAFTLTDGTRAGIVPTRGLRALTVQQAGVQWVAPDADVPVVFHVKNQAALDRVLTRFGARSRGDAEPSVRC